MKTFVLILFSLLSYNLIANELTLFNRSISASNIQQTDTALINYFSNYGYIKSANHTLTNKDQKYIYFLYEKSLTGLKVIIKIDDKELIQKFFKDKLKAIESSSVLGTIKDYIIYNEYESSIEITRNMTIL